MFKNVVMSFFLLAGVVCVAQEAGFKPNAEGEFEIRGVFDQKIEIPFDKTGIISGDLKFKVSFSNSNFGSGFDEDNFIAVFKGPHEQQVYFEGRTFVAEPLDSYMIKVPVFFSVKGTPKITITVSGNRAIKNKKLTIIFDANTLPVLTKMPQYVDSRDLASRGKDVRFDIGSFFNEPVTIVNNTPIYLDSEPSDIYISTSYDGSTLILDDNIPMWPPAYAQFLQTSVMVKEVGSNDVLTVPCFFFFGDKSAVGSWDRLSMRGQKYKAIAQYVNPLSKAYIQGEKFPKANKLALKSSKVQGGKATITYNGSVKLVDNRELKNASKGKTYFDMADSARYLGALNATGVRVYVEEDIEDEDDDFEYAKIFTIPTLDTVIRVTYQRNNKTDSGFVFIGSNFGIKPKAFAQYEVDGKTPKNISMSLIKAKDVSRYTINAPGYTDAEIKAKIDAFEAVLVKDIKSAFYDKAEVFCIDNQSGIDVIQK